MQLLTQALVATLLLVARVSAQAATYDITPLDAEVFKKEVTSSEAMWIVSFHAPGCLACEDFIPQFQDVAAKIAQFGVKAGSVDCEEHKRLCEEANVATAPYFKFYSAPAQPNPYTHKKYRASIDYTGKLDAKSLEKFIVKHLHHTVKRVDASSYTELQSQAKDTQQNIVIVFTERDQTSPLYKAASNAFNGKLVFVEVHSSVSELVSRYGIESFPQLGVVTVADDKFQVFAGDSRNLEEITAFLTGFAAADEVKSSDRTPLIPTDQLEARLSEERGAWVFAVSESGAADMIADWDKISKKAQGVVHSARIQCASTDSSDICAEFRRHGHPLLVVQYNSRAFTQFYPGTDGEKALTAALNSLPNQVNSITEHTMESFILQSNQLNKLSVIIATDKDTPTPFLKNLALSLSSHAQTAMLTGASTEFLARLQIHRVPTIVCTFPTMTPAPGEDGRLVETVSVVPYNGPSEIAGVAAFVRHVFQSSRFATTNEQPDTFEPSFGSASSQEPYEQVTPDNWDRLCPPSASALCAIAFVNGEEDNAAHVAELEKVKQSITGPFKFMWADGACLQSFADAFDVQVHKLPTVVAFSPLRMRIAQLVGSYESTNIRRLLEGVVRGSVATGPISERPTPDTECANAIIAEPVEELEDVDDLMEEIRREEEAEKKRLQQELEAERKQQAEEAQRKKSETKKPIRPKKANKKMKKTGRGQRNDDL